MIIQYSVLVNPVFIAPLHYANIGCLLLFFGDTLCLGYFCYMVAVECCELVIYLNVCVKLVFAYYTISVPWSFLFLFFVFVEEIICVCCLCLHDQ